MVNFSWNPILHNKLQAMREPLVKLRLADKSVLNQHLFNN